jgi:hypothetical protein
LYICGLAAGLQCCCRHSSFMIGHVHDHAILDRITLCT